MEQNTGRKGFRERFFNKKVLLIVAVLVIVGGTGFGVFMVKASHDPAFCTACHIMEPYYESYNNSNLLANKHAEAGLVCHDCHEPSITTQAEEGIKYITGNYQTPLEKRSFSKDFCLECHENYEEVKFENVKAKTDFEESNPHDSHNGELECNTCHSMHQQSQVMCAQCHLFVWTTELDDSWVK